VDLVSSAADASAAGERMRPRAVTIAVCVLDTIAWAVVAFVTFFSGSDPATKGLDQAAGVGVTALFAVTGAPAWVLTGLRRAPRAALTLALGFPAALALLLVAAIVAFAR
jgi:hypothetical protein